MPTAAPPRKLLMGRIGAAHGIKGEVRIQSFTEDPLALLDYGPLATNKPGLTIEILEARTTTNVLVARLKGVGDRNAAEKLNGVELFIDRALGYVSGGQIQPDNIPSLNEKIDVLLDRLRSRAAGGWKAAAPGRGRAGASTDAWPRWTPLGCTPRSRRCRSAAR